MKQARVQARVVSVICPECDSPISSPVSGKQDWAPIEVLEVANDPLYEQDDYVPTCEKCGCIILPVVPDWVKRAAEREALAVDVILPRHWTE